MLGFMMAVVAAAVGYIGMKDSASRKYHKPVVIHWLSILMSLFSFFLVGIPSIAGDYLWGGIFILILYCCASMKVLPQLVNNQQYDKKNRSNLFVWEKYRTRQKQKAKSKAEKLNDEIISLRKLSDKNRQASYDITTFSDEHMVKNKTTIRKKKINKKKILESGRISFDYIDVDGNYTSREIDISDVDSVYLKGYCYLSNGYRTFRIDRIQGDIVCRDTGEILCD
ncbi:hypothetical protein [Edwardsiella ictaluri]|uniref:WYL domain-containing protein n=1 Tax=Edwardsiella ictaluri TaxID=67780 RepID=UPI0039F728C3